MQKTTMKIGEVAKRADVSVDTVRFYERRGILPAPMRRTSGYRIYTAATVERLRLVRSLQTLSFSLDEIIDVLRAVDAGTATCANQEGRFEAALERIDSKIADLRATRRSVVAVLKSCRGGTCALREQNTVAEARGSNGKRA